MMDSCDLRVVLIAGNSGTGKSTVADGLARHLDASVLQVDDIRLALQAVTSERTHPDLHRFVGGEAAHWFSSPESVCAGLVSVADELEPALRAVMSHHIDALEAGPIVIEGDGLRPRLGSTDYLQGVDPWFQRVRRGSVRAVVLFEEDPARIESSMAERGRGFGAEPAGRRRSEILGGLQFGKRLCKDAVRYGIPVVASHPFETLLSRVIEALSIDL